MNNPDDFDNYEFFKENLTEAEVEDIESSIYIENNFFMLLAGTDKLEILPIPDENGIYVNKEEIEMVKDECKKQNIKLLYRISHGNKATVFNPDSKITGVVPENNPRGFDC